MEARQQMYHQVRHHDELGYDQNREGGKDVRWRFLPLTRRAAGKKETSGLVGMVSWWSGTP